MVDAASASGADRDELATDRDATAGDRDKFAADRDAEAAMRDDLAIEMADDARRRDEAVRQQLRAREVRAAARADADLLRHHALEIDGAFQQLQIDREVERSEAEWARRGLATALDDAEDKRAEAVGHRRAEAADRAAQLADRAAAQDDRLASAEDRRLSAVDRDQAEIDAQGQAPPASPR
jgi:hypothetical protein